jgi:hypothetical protein
VSTGTGVFVATATAESGRREPRELSAVEIVDTLAESLYPDDTRDREVTVVRIMALATSTDIEVVRSAGMRMLELATGCPWYLTDALTSIMPAGDR